MPNTATPPRIHSLSEIADQYDAILCDVWGVLHNGVEAFATAHPALQHFREEHQGHVVLVTNAPRPNGPVFEQLASFGISNRAFDAIVTSGDVTLNAIKDTLGQTIYHIGPDRDLGLFGDIPVTFASAEEADKVVCTGLFDDATETPEDYRPMLSRLAERKVPFICANPDIVVHRGAHEVYCAGALGELYAELGGPVAINGKPHPPIYKASVDALNQVAGKAIDPGRILAIGDAFRTDVKGAVDAGFDCLLITSGIHHRAFGSIDDPQTDKVHAELEKVGLGAAAFMPWLA